MLTTNRLWKFGGRQPGVESSSISGFVTLHDIENGGFSVRPLSPTINLVDISWQRYVLTSNFKKIWRY